MVYSASRRQATVQLPRPAVLPEAPGRLRRRSRSSLMLLRRAASTTTASTSSRTRCSAVVGAPARRASSASATAAAARRAGSRSGPIHVQPAEMAKLALVLWLAYSLAKKAEQDEDVHGRLPPAPARRRLLHAPLHEAARLRQRRRAPAPHVHAALRGRREGRLHPRRVDPRRRARRASLVRFSEYRYERYLAWLEHGRAPQRPRVPAVPVGHDSAPAASGSGSGRGLQMLYLPEAHTDFIAAIIGEELGFVGIARALRARTCCSSSRGVRAALRAPDDYGSYLAFGISTMFGVQALVNLAVAMAILPTKGLTLPFVSYGGSSLLVNAAAAGHPAQHLAPGARDDRRRAERARRARRRAHRRWSPTSADAAQPEARAMSRDAHPHRRRRHRGPRVSRDRRGRRASRARRRRASSSSAPRAASRRASIPSAATSSSSSTSSR